MKESQEIPVIQKRYTCQLNIASARQCYIGSTCRKTYVRFGINHPLLFVKQQQAMVILNTKICHYGLHIQSCWGCYDFKICQHFTYNLIGWKFKSESFLIFESTLTDWFTSGSSNCHHSLTLGSASRRSWWQNHRRLWANKALDIHHGWSSRNRDGWSATLCRLYSTIIYIWTCDHSYDKFLFNGLSFQKTGSRDKHGDSTTFCYFECFLNSTWNWLAFFSTPSFLRKKALMLLELNRKPLLDGWNDWVWGPFLFEERSHVVCRKGTSSQTLFLVNFS